METEEKCEDVMSQEEEKSNEDALPGPGAGGDVEEDTESFHPSEDKKPPEEDGVSEEAKSQDPPHVSPEQAELERTDTNYLKSIDERFESIAGIEQRLFNEIREMHKLYHSEFAGRLKSMQSELDQYHKIENGRAFDDILAAIARIYDNYENLADGVSEPKAKKNIRYMFSDIEELLELYGMSKLQSAVGDKRNLRHCQILHRIPTDDPEKHDTVAKSYNTGFHIGNRTVIREIVDVFFYDAKMTAQGTEKNVIIESGDSQTENNKEENNDGEF